MEKENPKAEAVVETAKDPGKFDWWTFFIPAIAAVFLAFAILFLVNGWSVFSGTAVAQKRAMGNRPVSALAKYEEVNNLIDQSNGKYSYGSKYKKNQVKLYNQLGLSYIDYMGSFISNRYSTSELKHPGNGYAKKMQKKYNQYNQAINAFQSAIQNAKDYKSMLSAFDKEVGDKVDSSIVNFFHYYAALMTGQKASVQREALDGIKDKEFRNPLEAEYALNHKQWATAEKYADKMLKRNKEDSIAYGYKAFAQRMQNDLEGATKTLNTGLKIDATSGQLNYQMAIIELLNGDYKTAEQYAYAAAAYGTSDETVSLYALTAELRSKQYEKAGNTDKAKEEDDLYKSMISMLEQYDAQASPDVQKILDGKKTLADVFLKGKGDLA